ncbi:MAG TPA: SRPBCC family protein [Pseudonocardia sp.]
MEVAVRVAGRAPVERVWERYAVPARWAGWAPHIRGVDLDPGPDRIAPGLTGRVRGPLGVAVAFVVTDVDETARTWAWTVRPAPGWRGLGAAGVLRMHLRHGVEPDPAGAATWLALRGPAPAVAAYLPVARVALARLVRP